MEPEHHRVNGRSVLVWRTGRPWLAISSAVHGGGIGEREWVLNATVPHDYDRDDPAADVVDLAAACGLVGTGTGVLTAVDVRQEVTTTDRGVTVTATTGIGAHPTWAAGGEALAWRPGTINVVGWFPVRLTPAALVNAVATAAEAKAQALVEGGVPGTGTPTDATVLLCPATGPAAEYGGPRSVQGSRLARAVHAAVRAGLRTSPTTWSART
ncbi:adenosylcobinamide amidohydrolase [Saccharothrix yanglingensis]|uniref:Adenosylcobinamide amidohydrolase n=1 Tax=Saccharothrix yanglingensis TaxID=659496 RepID=A0ABU0X8J2_9PSEU|nr:adenosylcobinamide amidohydrolase [Saccharothrix yanglingensis]MDQ2588291.1 adenosylcobinamide amidohydrolase [Saccharothrix yanglingensis]